MHIERGLAGFEVKVESMVGVGFGNFPFQFGAKQF
jgi:hypothetical protein